jgi:putative oxidoreductase
MNQNLINFSNTLLRLLLGIIFILRGKFKVDWGYVNLIDWLKAEGIPMATFWGYLLPWMEIVGGILVVVGVGTRYLSILFTLILLVALLQVKLTAGFISNTATGFEFDLLMLLVSIHVAITHSNAFKSNWNLTMKGGEQNNVQSHHH